MEMKPSDNTDHGAPSQEDEPLAKKTKVSADPPSAPPYGSQEYWDLRYKVQSKLETPTTESTATSPSEQETEQEDDGEKNDTLPYHAWYFTYKDLRPLILPLILGGLVDMDLFDGESEQYTMDETKSDNGGSRDKGEGGERVKPIEDENIKISKENEDEDHEDHIDDEKNDKESGDEGSASLPDDEVFEEVEDEENEDYDDEPPAREGVAKHGAVSILEVGCGDVPLGKDLAVEFIALEKAAGTKIASVVKKIVCCDYSPTVVAMMNEKKQEVEGMNSDKTATLDTILDFQTVDCRKMPYEDRAFEIILEKGTLDAMLSDKECGVSNCQQIIKECARVLAIGGYIFLVSHLNAHTDSGIEWLDQIVLPGLREGDQNARWDIEVHGNDGSGELEEGNDGEDASPTAWGPGPGVYIIRKTVRLREGDARSNDEMQTIPLRFFSY
jgi:SAM-dependent methyltransferase